MTIFEVYKEKEIKKKVVITKFKLEQGSGVVHLVAVDDDGHRVTAGYILKITRAGKLYIQPSINASLGLQITGEGKIQQTTYSS